MNKYDVIVIGAGHAGIEAADAAGRLGVAVLLVTLNIDDIGKLSCNPAIGGVAKGHLVREVDACGGLIGKIADQCALGYRFLNRSKGKAVWASRAQVDMFEYPRIARRFIEENKNITILQAKIKRLVARNKKISGIETNFGETILAKKVIICAGTFLKSTIHIGLNSFPGGRLAEESSDDLFASIKSLKISTKHFKTGTCARLDKRTLDFSKMQEQKPDSDAEAFSQSTLQLPSTQIPCYITYTNPRTHKIILKNLKYSPLYSGKIKSTGVRYCPSLEDKVVKFSHHDRHQVFIEPTGLNSIEIYPNGVSTSLPFNVQSDFIHSIEGLEKAVILRPGYGIEHGVVEARELDNTLESKKVSGLYFAGQLNGTTGYEEAAAQGMVAGINAALAVKNKKPFIFDRDNSFIGVLIDDLTKKGTNEPYRMFTSRSEFRLSVRESNADLRLAPAAYKVGLIDKSELVRVEAKKNLIARRIKELTLIKVGAVRELPLQGSEKISLLNWLKRPNVTYEDVEKHLDEKILNNSTRREVEIEVKYEGFLKREAAMVKQMRNFDRVKIPANIDYRKIPSLSKEVVEKMVKFKPKTFGEALEVSGITPAAIVTIYAASRKR